MPSPDARSASGLRPATAFFGVAGVLCAVAVKGAFIALEAEGTQPERWARVDVEPQDHFLLQDRDGRTLALSVECFDLHASPRSLWRAHTPERIAAGLARILERDPDEVLERLLPPVQPGYVPGIHRVHEPRLLAFGERTAGRVQRWIRSGATEEHPGAGPLPGLELVALPDGTYTLCVAPAQLLGRAAREQHLAGAADQPSRWTRRLLDDLAVLIDLEPHRDHPALREFAVLDLEQRGLREALREALWAELMPSQHRVVARGVGPVQARAVSEFMEREALSRYQLDLVATRERRHPVRPGGHAVVDPARRGEDDAFGLLGTWGVVPAERSAAVARARLGAGADEQELRAERHELETSWRPWSGIERAAWELLAREDWRSLLEERPRAYVHRVRSVPRDRHEGWRRTAPGRRLDVPDYYGADRAGEAPPVVTTTLDAALQQALHERLLEVMDEHEPALAMGIVVDVERGDVLAADGVYAYAVSGFAPLTHTFTPGSTFKAVVMATALDAGVVRPEERFETFAGSGIVVRDGRSARRIGEAEGAPTEAWITATDGLAESVNAVLVQIGLRVDAPRLRDRLAALGYGRAPEVALGPALGGSLPELVRGTWSRVYTHASVAFGHEVSVTLWQHAAALATLARGGEFLPLRVVERVEQGGRAFEPRLAEPRRVLSREACEATLAMMAEGARRGTGAPIAAPEACPEFEYLGTKTGTTEKKSSEFCLHVELPHIVEHARRAAEDPEHPAARCHADCLEQLRYRTAHRPGRQSCYTSSMLAVGRLPGDGRTVLVLVVVEDARSRSRFGRDVAGQAAIDVLRRSLDLAPREGRAPVAASFPLGGALNDRELPWLESIGRGLESSGRRRQNVERGGDRVR